MAIIEKLDQAFIDTQLHCPPGDRRIEFVDPLRTGLYIEVRATSPGQGTYYLRYKDAAGKTCHQKLGRTIEMTLFEARKQARNMKASITMGADPRGEAKAQKAVPTFDEFFNDSYLPYAEPRKRSYKKDRGMYLMYVAGRFGQTRINAIRRQDVHEFHAGLLKIVQPNGKTLSPAMADHVVKLIRQMLNKAVEWEIIPHSPIALIKLFNVDNRLENYQTPEQLACLLDVLVTDDNRGVCEAAILLLCSGARLNEALKSKVSHYELGSRVWRIEAMTSKSKRVRSVPLNDMAIELVTNIIERDGLGPDDYLFNSAKTGEHLRNVHKVWDRLRKKAGLPHLRLHDLRHQYASFLVNSGRSLYEVQKILGHSSHSVTERYAHLSSKSLMDAANSASLAIRDAMPRAA
ncbi:MAG: site-specific integrase [Pseudomonadota bacterium]